jgi:hypothetical protein
MPWPEKSGFGIRRIEIRSATALTHRVAARDTVRREGHVHNPTRRDRRHHLFGSFDVIVLDTQIIRGAFETLPLQTLLD